MTAIPQQTQACPYGTGRLLLFTTAAVVARISTHSLPAQWPWSSMAVAAIAIAVWHGAFDGVLAEETLRPQWGVRWKPTFYVFYLAATALVILLWWAVPVVALALFLLYSALHFGTQGERYLPLGRLLTGGGRRFRSHCWSVPLVAGSGCRNRWGDAARRQRSRRDAGVVDRSRALATCGRGACGSMATAWPWIRCLRADPHRTYALPLLLSRGGIRHLLLPVAYARTHGKHQSG